MVDRQSIKNDLIAISNAVSRDEDLGGIAKEIAVVLENMAEVAAEEKHAADPKTDNNSRPEGD